jgi:hypothetical protein
MAVMDRDNIVVGNSPPSAKLAPKNPEKPSRAGAICGAMSQQRGDNSNQSAPQKFVRLVGCHNSKARLTVKR